ncbi:hydroxymethylglutaryl-CoA lyase [Mucilaginibacter pallidiroseus]|uniref:Hydroxymethylglutaryl-CoA lyase n=1 Tax=Mucilaginibacter pallidiroseus TaxID=2599295 RepID=A0A563UCQ2_9SPHI|nr:hydroxymethylglutaryl-CoA lyase [Mucilaginibacter pallidiroseus]TWR29110.1 hydroxymethylglutaryl-CoA lyase [Mucilaginibacter pallidiroseus]
MSNAVKLTECPRDAMQGLHNYIPAEVKAHYINLLLQVGFDTIDFGSFVSPKAIPQMRDTAEVLAQLDITPGNRTKLLAIVANYRGAEQAAQFDEISYLGFPFSISETFQLRNTNASITEALDTVKQIAGLCALKNKTPLVYLSMGFGNPYSDDWSTEAVLNWTGKLVQEGITQIALSDTIGIATPEQISILYPALQNAFPQIELGLHLHSTTETWQEKIAAAYDAGCRKFDTSLKGYGGCPMAKDDLTGNIATENVVAYLLHNNIQLDLDLDKLGEAMEYANGILA